MKFTISWLKDYLDTEANLSEIVDTLNRIGLEVEEVIDKYEELKYFNCVKIEECVDHPDSDHLHICHVRISNDIEPITVICGAPNVRVGMKTILAPVGSVLPDGTQIKKAKIRGVESSGMLCSIRELGLGENHDGIIEVDSNIPLGTNICTILNLNDPVIEISITPNRGDSLGVYGIARDLAVAGLGELKKLEDLKLETSFKSPITLSVRDPDCYQYAFRYLRNLQNVQSPVWLQNRLSAIGINPKNVLVDVTNYVMFSLGQPLHCYDYSKIEGNLIVRSALENEQFLDLFGKCHTLSGDETLICDDNKVLCLGGVLGGNTSSTSIETKDVILEAAIFNPINTAKTGRTLGIESDARYRFERGIDCGLLHYALDLSTQLILDICGGEASNIVEYIDKSYLASRQRSIDLNINKIEKILGLALDRGDVLNILSKSGYKIIDQDNNILNLLIPTWKNSVLVPEDIIDDILRIYGYDSLEDNDFINGTCFKKPGNDLIQIKQDKLFAIRKKMAANGLTELVSYVFTNKNDLEFFTDANPNLQILNPIISDLNYVRQSLLPNILTAIKKNSSRGVKNICLFEFGKVFNSNVPGDEVSVLSGVRYGCNQKEDIYTSKRSFDIFDVKKDIMDALSVLNIDLDKLVYTRDVPKYYHPNKSGAVYIGKQVVGFFGELHPSVIEHFDLDNKVNVFELYIDKIPKKLLTIDTVSRTGFNPNDLLPITRDFAFVVDSDIEVGNILKEVGSLNKSLISNVWLFDIYKNPSEPRKKSVAFSITLQPSGKTMVKDEIDQICNEVINLVEIKYNGILRDK